MADDGLKSAYELAMDRLEAKDGSHTALTDKQKTAIAEAEQKGKARIAEIEIMTQQDIAKAAGDPEKLAVIEEHKLKDINKAKADIEKAKKRIRKD